VKGAPEKKIYIFDVEHERKRKEQLKKLFDRTSKQIEEEQVLLNELKKIEARKKERERKTQDLQKLISQADQKGDTPQTPSSTKKYDKKLKKKVHNQLNRPSKVDAVVGAFESAGIKFSDLRGTGVSLRSQKMKLPANVGQKKSKALEQVLQEFKLENPPPTDEIIAVFNDLRSDMVLLSELRTALTTCNFELESLKHQYEVLCPGKTLNIPLSLIQSNLEHIIKQENAIDIAGSPAAALNL
jgi:DNA methyltransferase 1-associated protein 1